MNQWALEMQLNASFTVYMRMACTPMRQYGNAAMGRPEQISAIRKGSKPICQRRSGDRVSCCVLSMRCDDFAIGKGYPSTLFLVGIFVKGFVFSGTGQPYATSCVGHGPTESVGAFDLWEIFV